MSDENPGPIEAAADKVHALHEKIAAGPFGVLEQISVTKDVAKAVRSVHDAAADAAYGLAGKLGAAADRALGLTKHED